MQKDSKKITVSISQELYDALKRLAEQDFRTVPGYIRVIVREHVKKTTAG